jgi:two-component system cell cycle sensor histidine kinase/response regulator CckA
MMTEMQKYEQSMFPGSKKWILVLHEESTTKTDMRRKLEESGYRVYLVGSSDDAAECYSVAQDCGYPFAAVIMDASDRGGAEGRAAIKRLLDIDPDVKAIVVGEDEKNPILSDFKTYGFRGALVGQFSSQELDQLLRGTLDAGKETV